VLTGTRFTIAGLGFLALAMTGAVGLVTDVVYGEVTAVVCAAIIGLLFALVWYALPIRRRAKER
jgi:hypothetical protein